MTIMSSILQNPQASIMSSLLSSTASAAVAIPDSLIRLQETYVGRDGSGGPSNTGDLIGFMADISQMGDVTIPAQPELVTNGTFDTDSDWTKQTGWTISGGKAVASNSSYPQGIIQSSIGWSVGEYYEISFEVSGIDASGGGISLVAGGLVNIINNDKTNGIKRVKIRVTDASASLIIRAGDGSSSTTANIDNISVKRHVDPVQQYLDAQPELVTNGGFDTDTTGWTSNLEISSVGGQIHVVGGTSYCYQTITTVVGEWYKLSGDIVSLGSSFTAIRKSDSQNASLNSENLGDSVGSHSMIFKATATTTYIVMQVNSAGVGVFDNISIKALSGNHAIAPSDAARPTKTAGGFSLDGVNDILEMPKPSGDVTNCTVLMRWKRLNDDDRGIVLGDGGSAYLCIYDDNNATTALSGGFGNAVTKIDGITMITRNDVYNASASACDTVMTGVDFSSIPKITIAGYNSGIQFYMPNIEIADRGFMIFDHTPTDAEITAAFASMGTLS